MIGFAILLIFVLGTITGTTENEEPTDSGGSSENLPAANPEQPPNFSQSWEPPEFKPDYENYKTKQNPNSKAFYGADGICGVSEKKMNFLNFLIFVVVEWHWI